MRPSLPLPCRPEHLSAEAGPDETRAAAAINYYLRHQSEASRARRGGFKKTSVTFSTLRA
jgi:hypothetical protein